MNPTDVVVPILAINEQGQVEHFLGTGFFVGPNGLLLTAEHVVRDWPEGLAIVCMKDLKTLHTAIVLETDRPHDMALLRVATYAPEPLTLAFEDPITPNVQIITLEYGTTETAGNHITLNPATRIGNVTRIKSFQMLGAAGDTALELSFPALRGASGAPVMRADNFHVWGIVVANVDSHLLPAQIESVLDERNNIYEEIRYMLPQAAAVNIRHARAMYGRHA